MTTTKTSKISLNIFDDKRFYVNNIKSYPHDENLYLFKRDLVSKICEQTSSVVIQRTSSMASQASLNLNKEQLVDNILELNMIEKLLKPLLDYIMICKAVSLSVKQVLRDLSS